MQFELGAQMSLGAFAVQEAGESQGAALFFLRQGFGHRAEGHHFRFHHHSPLSLCFFLGALMGHLQA